MDDLGNDGSLMDAGSFPALDAQVCSPSADSACACAPPDSGQVLAHWPLDESAGLIAANATSQASAGTLQGFGDLNPWLVGKRAGALSFDGVDDRVQVGFVRGEVKTVALWLKPGSAQEVLTHTVVQLPDAHGPLDEWTDPENAYLDDGKLATAASAFGQKFQHWGGFHLTQLLPAGAIIQGITVSVDTGNLGVLGAFTVELSSDGGQSHTSLRSTWGQLIGGSNLRQAGGADKLWGRTWTVDDFSDDRFRVWASFGGIANAMGLDFLGVEVHYSAQAAERTVLTLSEVTSIELAGLDGKTIATSGWPGSSIFVNGRAGGALGDDWNHVVVVSQTGIAATDVQLGNAVTGQPSSPYHGLMDDVALLDVAITPDCFNAKL